MKTKKYCYNFIDLNEKIYADNGDECQAIYDATHDEEYHGNVELTNLETGEVKMMYPIVVH